MQSGFLPVYPLSVLDTPQVLFCSDAEECAKALGMVICREAGCSKHDPRLGPHSHTDCLAFSGPHGYPEGDAERAGQYFREHRVAGNGVRIVWHLWSRNSDPPPVYYCAADIIIIIPAERGNG